MQQQSKTFAGQWHQHLATLNHHNSELSKHIVELTLNQYAKLPKNGKPSAQKQEWTLLASICQCEQFDEQYRLSVVALGTGTKCIGYDMMKCDGSLVHDAHAEVMARRSFMRYLYYQMNRALESTNHNNQKDNGDENNENRSNKKDKKSSTMISDDSACILEYCVGDDENNKSGYFRLKSHVSFHFFVNQSPCGDASIHAPAVSTSDEQQEQQIEAKSADTEEEGNSSCVNNENTGNEKQMKRTRDKETTNNETDVTENPLKKLKTNQKDENCGRTGARPITSKAYVPGAETETEFGSTEQKQGIVRTKPGRGPRTISMSCSDKLSKWNVLGIQGSLISQFIPEPIRMSTITIGNSVYFEPESMQRAFDGRMLHVYSVMHEHLKDITKPYFMCCELNFQDGKSDERVNACSTSMLYVAPNTAEAIIGHRGNKLGVGKKDLSKPKCFSVISPYKFLESYCELRKALDTSSTHDDNETVNYLTAKSQPSDYVERRKLFFGCEPFDHWVFTDPEKYYSFSLHAGDK